MIAFLDDAALVEHDQPVHCGDGRQTVRDGHHRLALHQAIEALLDRGFDFAVERAGGFIEQQDGGVFEHNSRDGNPLPLAAAQLDSALADVGSVAGAPHRIAQHDDEVVRLGALRRGLHLGIPGIGPAVADIVADGSMQKRRILSHHADLGAQTILRRERDVLAVDQHPSLRYVIEAQQQIDDGALPGAGTADETDFLARTNMEIEIVDHGARRVCDGAIGEAHPFEAYVAARDPQRLRIGAVQHGGRPGQRGDAVLNGADLLEQRGHLPHDPV